MKIEVDLKATEDRKKVIDAVHNVFPDAVLRRAGGKLLGETDGKKFEELIAGEQIRNAIFKEEKKGYIDLSKIAAIAGKASLDENFPLGKIRLILK